MIETKPLSLEQLGPDEYLLNMGPQHPSTHGVLRIVLKMDGEVIKQAVPHIGYLHRGLEKLFENRTYAQTLPFTDRTDYLAAMNNNFAYVMAVEKLLGIAVPERAEYIRVIMAELNRIMSHLLWYAAYGLDLGGFAPFWYAFREREEVIDLVEMASGARLIHSYYRIGGFKNDLPADFFPKLKKFLSHFNGNIKEYEDLLINNVIFVHRTRDVGIMSAETSINYGVTGPSLRGSNNSRDIRKDTPYSAYPKFSFDVPVGKNGDCWDRSHVRMEEMRQSARILTQAMEGIPAGEVMAKVPRNIKPPAGEAYARVEGPRGEIGTYLVSDGSEKPFRHKMRKPSFSNLSILGDMAVGCKIADIVAIIGSLDVIIPEMDR
jgi:NADH-quinone oxidoreductase subunit D